MAEDQTKQQVTDLKREIEAKQLELKGSMDVDSALVAVSDAQKASTDQLRVRRTLKGHFGKVYAIHWAGKNASDKLVSASQDGKLIVWNAHTTNKLTAIPLRSSWVMTCAFERGGNNAVACGGLDNLCSIYKIDSTDSAGSKAEIELAHHDGYLSCCRFVEQKSSEIVTSSGDSTCILWDITNAIPAQHFNAHTSDVMSIALKPNDPNIFVSGSCDAKCIAWDVRLASEKTAAIFSFSGHESDINSVEFFPDGMAFGTGSDDSSCRIFDMRCYNQVQSCENDKILCGVTSVAFSKSGRLLAAGYDDYYLAYWDTLGSAREPKRDMQHENRVSCIGMETMGHALATGSWDTVLKVHA